MFQLTLIGLLCGIDDVENAAHVKIYAALAGKVMLGLGRDDIIYKLGKILCHLRITPRFGRSNHELACLYFAEKIPASNSSSSDKKKIFSPCSQES
jgi:hypothetical protein